MKIPSSNLGRTRCTLEIVSDIQTIFVHNMFFPCSAKRRASDKDLPVSVSIITTSYGLALLKIFHGPKTQHKFNFISKFHYLHTPNLGMIFINQLSHLNVVWGPGESVKNRLNQQNMSTMRPKNGQIFSREVGIFWQIGEWRVKELAFTLPTNLPKKYPNVFKIKTHLKYTNFAWTEP